MDTTAALQNLPKHGVVRQGYQYDLSGALRPVPEEMQRDKMMPTLPLLILDARKNELGHIRYVKWQDGGLVVLIGKIPLEGILVFTYNQEVLRKLRITRLPNDVQASNILPLSEAQFGQMLSNFQQMSNMTISVPPGKLLLQRISEEGTSTPIVARAFFSILKLREAATGILQGHLGFRRHRQGTAMGGLGELINILGESRLTQSQQDLAQGRVVLYGPLVDLFAGVRIVEETTADIVAQG
jgi:hypothetical protein